MVLVFLFYIDECGDSSIQYESEKPTYTLADKVSPYFTLSAVGIRDSSRQPLAEAMFEIKERHFGSRVRELPWGDSEIKGRFLRRAARSAANGGALPSPVAYRELDSPEKAAHLIDDLGLLIDKHRPIILSVTVDKRRLVRTKDPSQHNALGVAYTLLHERIALSLEKLFAGESAILIADQQTEHERYFRSGEMNRLRDKVSGNLRVKPNFELVVDKPLWLDTDLSSWDREILQLADITAYSCHSCVESGEAPEYDCYLWPQIRRAMALHWRKGEVHQAGFTVYPRSRRYYPRTE